MFPRGRFMKIQTRLAFALACLLSFTFLITSLASDKDPRLSGTLFFHRYSDYASWDGELLALDLESGELREVSKSWKTILSPINAHISSDGQYMTFMGSQLGLVENDWDVFLSHWNGSAWEEPVNLTGLNGKRDEDPKFSPDGRTIIYKEDGILATVLREGGAKTYLTKGRPQSSMPYYALNGRDILFERSGKIMLLKGGQTIEMEQGPGAASYYPIGVDDKRYLFTRIQENRHDSIRWGYYDGSPSEPLFFNSRKFDSSDSYPYRDGKRFIFLVSGDYTIFKGGYNLMVADLNRKINYDIDALYGDINTGLEELGPAWTPFTYDK